MKIGFSKNRGKNPFVIPAKADNHSFPSDLDARLRGRDDSGIVLRAHLYFHMEEKEPMGDE
jgi:hypothetical protein